MNPSERGLVYIFVNSTGVVEPCSIVVTNFDDNGQCLLYGLNSKANYIANVSEMYESSEECMRETTKKHDAEYALHYDAFDSIEAVLLHSLYAGMTGKKLEELELLALINRASDFLGADVLSALEKYAKAMEKENKRKFKDKEVCLNV